MSAFSKIVNAAAIAMGLALILGCTVINTPPSSREAQEHMIDDQANETIKKLYAGVPGSRELAREAAGILVFPSFNTFGPFVDGVGGIGVLRGYREKAYFQIAGLPQQLRAGPQCKSLVFLLLTPTSLERLGRSTAWTAGLSAAVAAARMGTNAKLDQPPSSIEVVAFTMADSGLVAAASIEGTRIKRVERTVPR